jgi:hypothetical protein
MSINKVLVGFIFIFQGILSYSQSCWPFLPQNEQKRITGTVGEHRGSHRFHLGVDIKESSADIGMRVYSINSGHYSFHYTGNAYNTSYIQVGDVLYRHIKPTNENGFISPDDNTNVNQAGVR